MHQTGFLEHKPDRIASKSDAKLSVIMERVYANIEKFCMFRLYERPFDTNTPWIFGLFIYTELVVGILLNALTVAVIIKYKKLRSAIRVAISYNI